MTFVLDRLMSATWPFELPMEGFPNGLFCDAHILLADSFSLTSVILEQGVISLQGTLTFSGHDTSLHSRATAANKMAKIQLLDDNDVSHGWMMLGNNIPDSFIMDGINRPICASLCIPADGIQPVNASGMTGNWTVVGEDGVLVDHEEDGSDMTITFNADEDYFVVRSGDDVDYDNGIGICSIAGATGPTVSIDIAGEGGVFAITESEDGETVIRDVLFIPDMKIEYPVYEDPDKDAEVRSFVFRSPTITNGNEDNITWAGGLTYSESFYVTSPDYTGSVELNKYLNGKYGPTLFIRWAACDRKDYIRSVIKTSEEDGSSEPYPLDEILRDH